MSEKAMREQSPWHEAWRSRYISPSLLQEWVIAQRAEKKTIATLNGSFDLLHAGHLHIIYEASQVCDVLIVALNSDASIKRYKSPSRPLIPLEYRLEMMAALRFVDAVTHFEEDDPRELLRIIKPDVHVNGAEYGQQCIEAEVVRQGGGRIHIVDLLPGLSTSNIVQKIEAELLLTKVGG